MKRHNKFAVVVAGIAASVALSGTSAIAETATPLPSAAQVQIAQAADATILLGLIQAKLALVGATVQSATAAQLSAAVAEVAVQNRGMVGEIASIAALARPDLAPEIEQAAVGAAPEAAPGISEKIGQALSAPSADQLAAVENVTGQPAGPVSAAAGTASPVIEQTVQAPPVGPGVDGSDS